ncbi:unnamed protein product [Candida verbasci]|uniref:Major facilitator superfamily (MFS) profile domain-containing protein n=1 Tax=Candida verbasci TaxID=1227364 RepID=A0A9W4X809_9ASCO|nr:unnamed protein product [Candida verbasci]
MLRPVGATIFGLAGDYLGRKWTYIIIATLFIAVEVGTGLAQTYSQFLGVRALFGVLMGGMYPIAMVTALEDQPTEARGALSGIFLPGYNMGYLLAQVFYLAFASTGAENEGWRNLLFFTAGLSVILIVWRFLYPESPSYLKLKERKKIYNEKRKQTGTGFWSRIDLTILKVLKTEWLMFSYLVVLYACFNFASHASQDLYASMLTNQYGADLNLRTIIIVVSNIGAIIGGLFMGNVSEILGRRLTIIVCLLWAVAFTWSSFNNARENWPLYVLLQGGVMGAWGVAPIHLMELVNPTYRAFLAGLAYQLGNLISSASSTIQARIGENFPLEEEGMYDYGFVMAIFCFAVFACHILCVFLGPERFHRELRITDREEEIENTSSKDDGSKDDGSKENSSNTKKQI